MGGGGRRERGKKKTIGFCVQRVGIHSLPDRIGEGRGRTGGEAPMSEFYFVEAQECHVFSCERKGEKKRGKGDHHLEHLLKQR